MFKIEGLEYFLILIVEVFVINIYVNEILDVVEFLIKYCVYIFCFRFEVGLVGRDIRGLVR